MGWGNATLQGKAQKTVPFRGLFTTVSAFSCCEAVPSFDRMSTSCNAT